MTQSTSSAHARELLIAEVAEEGVPGLARVLHASADPESPAAALTVGELVRALPGIGWIGAHDLLKLVGAQELTPLAELDVVQRSALTSALSRTPPPMED